MAGAASKKDQPINGRIFVSYSRRDKEFAEGLTAALTEHGFEAFLDVKDIAPGEPWQERLSKLIRAADTVVFIVSPDSLKSEICGWEANEASKLGKRILPVVHRRVDGIAIPEAISRINFIFMGEAPTFDPQFALLTSALQTDLDWIREHTRLADLAANWEALGRRSADMLRGQALEQAEKWAATRPKDAPDPTEQHRAYIAESRRGATRRQRFGVVGALSVAVFAVGLAIFANEQRKTAQRNYALALDTVNDVIFQFAQGFKTVEGIRGEVITRVLERAKTSLDRLGAAAPDDTRLQRLRSVQLNEFGDILKVAGDTAAALKAYEDGLLIARKLAGTDPTNTQWQRDLSVSYNKIGDLKRQAGDTAAALKAYEDGLLIRRKLAGTDPTNTQWQRDLSVSYDKIGDLKQQAGDTAAALKAYEDGLLIRRKLAGTDPTNTQWQRDLSVSYNKIGDLKQQAGDTAAALKAYEDGLLIARKLAGTDPTNTQWQRDLINVQRRIRIINESKSKQEIPDWLKAFDKPKNDN
jgi:tetratricopeptide (TPR) repeat protein